VTAATVERRLVLDLPDIVPLLVEEVGVPPPTELPHRYMFKCTISI